MTMIRRHHDTPTWQPFLGDTAFSCSTIISPEVTAANRLNATWMKEAARVG